MLSRGWKKQGRVRILQPTLFTGGALSVSPEESQQTVLDAKGAEPENWLADARAFVKSLEPVAEGDEGIEEEDFGENAPVKVRTKPIQPSKKEVEEHQATHYPYRSWCRYCVAASGRRDKHASVSENQEDEVVCIACDYGFFTSKEDEDKPEEELEKKYTPFLATVDDSTKSTFGDVVHRKGVAD